MTDLYLIAHKVRGEPAFDVAIQIPCPECINDGPEPTCSECDGLGYWWIIPTSGHRAYPYHHVDIEPLLSDVFDMPMPPSLPDHYHTTSTTRPSLAEALGIKPKAAAKLPPIARRL